MVWSFLHHLLFEALLDFSFGLGTHFGQTVLNTLLDRQVEFALFLDKLGLCLLGLGQLLVPGFEDFLKFGKLARFALKLGGGGELRLSGFVGNQPCSLGLELTRHLIGHLFIQSALGLGDLLFLLADTLLAPGNLFVLLRKLLLELLAGGSEQWGCKRLRQSDFGLAVRARDGGFGQDNAPLSSCRCGSKTGTSLWMTLHRVSLSMPR